MAFDRRNRALRSFMLQGAAGLVLLPISCGPKDPGNDFQPRRVRTTQKIVASSVNGVDFLAWLGRSDLLAAIPAQVLRYGCAWRDPSLRRGLEELPRFRSFRVEEVLALEPDLVLADSSQSPEVCEELRRRGIEVLVLAPVRDYPSLERELGRVVIGIGGGRADVRAARRRLRDSFKAARKSALRKPISVLPLSGFGTALWTAGNGSLADWMIRLAGAENAARALGIEGHARISAEAILRTDPEWVLVEEGERGGVWNRFPALKSLPAIREGRILRLSPRLRNAASPYVFEAAVELAKQLGEER